MENDRETADLGSSRGQSDDKGFVDDVDRRGGKFTCGGSFFSDLDKLKIYVK